MSCPYCDGTGIQTPIPNTIELPPEWVCDWCDGEEIEEE